MVHVAYERIHDIPKNENDSVQRMTARFRFEIWIRSCSLVDSLSNHTYDGVNILHPVHECSQFIMFPIARVVAGLLLHGRVIAQPFARVAQREAVLPHRSEDEVSVRLAGLGGEAQGAAAHGDGLVDDVPVVLQGRDRVAEDVAVPRNRRIDEVMIRAESFRRKTLGNQLRAVPCLPPC